MISVIIPAYNAAETLDQCIQALRDSECPADGFEIIVVDDCSVDGTGDIARRYGCRVFRTQENSGAAVSRNYGSVHATGDILFFIDSDVFVESDVLEKIDVVFRNSPDIDAVVGAYRSWQPNTDFWSRYQTLFTFYNHEQCQEGTIHWFWGACGAIRKSVFEDIGRFDEKYMGAGAEDIELGYDLSDGGHRIVLDKSIHVVHCHRHTIRSILRNNLKKSSEWCTLFLAKNLQNRYKHGFTSSRNGITISLTWIAMSLLILYLIGMQTQMWIALGLLALVITNHGFYRFIFRQTGGQFLIKALYFHWLTYFFIGFGIILGIARFMLPGKAAQ